MAWVAKTDHVVWNDVRALQAVVDNKDFTNLNGKTYVLIGAGSAMGPFIKLMELGATVVALDIPGTLITCNHPSNIHIG